MRWTTSSIAGCVGLINGCGTDKLPGLDSGIFSDCDDRLPDYCELGEDHTSGTDPEDDAPFRGVHLGTNSGLNYEAGVNIATGGEIPGDYFTFLSRTNANWVGLSVALRYSRAERH